MALAQIVVFPAPGTPYSRGAFLFDVYFPTTYPSTPPLVNLQTTGRGTFRFNPNLYKSGKVCLSLLNTWRGAKSEQWNPHSTFLQVCVSIQSAIFVGEPYFNEPGYETEMKTAQGRAKSNAYNAAVRNATIQYAMLDYIKKPPSGFEYVVLSHFYLHQDAIIQQVEGWIKDGKSKGPHFSKLKSLVAQLKVALQQIKQPVPPVDSDSDTDDSSEDDD